MKKYKNSEELLAEANINVLSAPIDIEAILAFMDIRIQYIPKKETEVIASLEGSTIILDLNTSRYESRKRFLLAHIIGHVCLHEGLFFKETVDTIDSEKSYWNIQECEANNFASQLLMPYPLILKEGEALVENKKTSGIKFDTKEFIEKMSHVFKVPYSHMEERLSSLNLLPKEKSGLKL